MQSLRHKPIEVWFGGANLYAVFITNTIEFIPVIADTGQYDCVYLNSEDDATYELVATVKGLV